MNKQRLLILADALRTRIPADKFDLTVWRKQSDETDEDGALEENASDEELLNQCGTAGCAVGWACALPEFKEEGLSWCEGSANPLFTVPKTQYGGWEAVEAFFDIDYKQARSFFGSESHPRNAKPEVVAAKIEEFCK